MSVYSSLATLAKGLFTTARIADAGLNIYMIGDMIWTDIDPGSRYPEQKQLAIELLENGKIYDEKLNEYINESGNLTNLSNALIIINTTAQTVDDRVLQINKRYNIIDQQIKIFEEKYPTLRNWFDEAWARKNNPDASLARLREITSTPGKSAVEIIVTIGYISFGTATTAWQVKSLVSDGLKWYRQRRNGGLPLTRPRSNAIYRRPARSGYWQQIQGAWTQFKINYPKLYTTLKVSLTGVSLGLNIFAIVSKAKAATAREEYLRGESNKFLKGTANVQLFMNGARTVSDLSRLTSEYKLDELVELLKTLSDQRLNKLLAESDLAAKGGVSQDEASTEGQGGQDSSEATSLTPAEAYAVDLAKGVHGLLADCNNNLAQSCDVILKSYDGILAVADGAAGVSEEDKAALEPLRRANTRSNKLVSQIKEETDGAKKKQKIEELSMLARDELIGNFDKWIADLDDIITISKIQSLVALEAKTFIEDFPPERWASAMDRKAKRLMATLDSMFPGRRGFSTEAEVKSLLEHFVNKLSPQLVAA